MIDLCPFHPVLAFSGVERHDYNRDILSFLRSEYWSTVLLCVGFGKNPNNTVDDDGLEPTTAPQSIAAYGRRRVEFFSHPPITLNVPGNFPRLLSV